MYMYLRSQSNDSALQCILLTSRNELLDQSLEAAFSQRDSFSTATKICLFLVTCHTTVVQENWYFLLSISTLFAWCLSVTNLIGVEILFFLLLDMKIWVVHAFWTPSRQPRAWTNFGWNLAKLLSDSLPTMYKTVSANFNSPFHFKVIAYLPLLVAIISHSQIYLLVKIKQMHIPEI